jgi:hypothetical protein
MQASDQLNTMAALSLRKEHPQGPLYRKLGTQLAWTWRHRGKSLSITITEPQSSSPYTVNDQATLPHNNLNEK